MEKNVRNAIATTAQNLRTLLEDEYFEQLEGLFDVLRDGWVAKSPGAHLSTTERVVRSKIVAAIQYPRASGLNDAEAVSRFVRDAAFTSLNRFVALKMLEARGLVQECVAAGSDSAGYREFIGLAPGPRTKPLAGFTSSLTAKKNGRQCVTRAPRVQGIVGSSPFAISSSRRVTWSSSL